MRPLSVFALQDASDYQGLVPFGMRASRGFPVVINRDLNMKTKKAYKTALFSLISGAAIFGLAACGGPEAGDDTTAADAPAEEAAPAEPAPVVPDEEPAPGEVEPEASVIDIPEPVEAPDDEEY
jgi:hypothetical protein